MKNHLYNSTGDVQKKNKGEMRMKRDFLKKLKRFGTMALAVALVTTLIGSNNMYVTAAEEVLGLEQESEVTILVPDEDAQTPEGEDSQTPEGEDAQTPEGVGVVENQIQEPQVIAEAPAAPVMMMSRGISFRDIKLHMTVTDNHGAPLQGATVTFTYYDDRGWLSDEYESKSGTTDANGFVTVLIGTRFDKVTNYTVSLANYGTVSVNVSDSIGTGLMHTNERSYSAQLTANVSNPVSFVYSNDFEDGHEITQTHSVLYNEAVAAPADADVQRVGYSFTGWNPSDADLAHVKAPLTLTAQYVINTYDVTFVDAKDNKLAEIAAVEHGTAISALGVAAPENITETVAGVNKTYTFSTWGILNADNSVTPVGSDYEVVGEVTFKAVYTDEVNFYVVTLIKDVDNVELLEVSPETVNLTIANPTKYGHNFIGWLVGESTTPVKDYLISNLEAPLTLTAVYEKAEYPVTYNYKKVSTDGRKAEATATTANVQFEAGILSKAPASEGLGFETKTHKYTFAGWYTDATVQTEETLVTEEDLLNSAAPMQVYAKYEMVTIAYFYVLNPGLSMPDEAGQYASNRYSNGVKLYGVLPLTYKGGYVFNTEDLAAGLDASVFTEGTVFPTASQFRTTQGRGTNLPENAQITWYVVKTAGGTYHVDGFVNNQEYPLTINYVYEGEEAEQAAATYTAMVGFEDAFAVPSPAIEFYTPSLSTVSGVMTGDDTNPLTGLTYTVVYSRTTVPFTVNYYSGSLTGIWLNAVTLNVNLDVLSAPDAQAQLAAMAGVNTYRPGNMSSGLIRQFDTENRVMGIVYEPIEVVKSYTVTFVDQFGNTLKTETVTEGNDATAPATLAIAGFTFANWDKAFTDITADTVVTALYTAIPAPGPAPAPTPAPTPAPAEEVVVIEEEETPLAETPEEVEEETPAPEEEVVEIEEEETPLAVLEGDCIIHWIILLITAMYAVYGVLRAVARNKKIRQLQGANDQVNA